MTGRLSSRRALTTSPPHLKQCRREGGGSERKSPPPPPSAANPSRGKPQAVLFLVTLRGLSFLFALSHCCLSFVSSGPGTFVSKRTGAEEDASRRRPSMVLKMAESGNVCGVNSCCAPPPPSLQVEAKVSRGGSGGGGEPRTEDTLLSASAFRPSLFFGPPPGRKSSLQPRQSTRTSPSHSSPFHRLPLLLSIFPFLFFLLLPPPRLFCLSTLVNRGIASFVCWAFFLRSR